MTTRRNLHLHQYNHSNKSAVVILRSFVFGLAVYTCSHVVLFCSLSFSPKYASPVVVDNQPIPSVHRKLRHLLVDPLCFHDEPEVVNATVLVEQFESLKDSKLKQLINAPSLISWTRTTDKFFEEFNITAVLSSFLDIQKMHGWPNAEKIQVWSTTAHPYYIWDGNICFAAKRFAEAGSVKPHVLFTYLNENRGAFSRDVKHKTANWNHLSTHWSSWGCKDEEIYSYLNHKNTRAVITTQHQSIDHPKVWSIPLGVKEGRLPKKILEAIQEPRVNRTQLLMVNDNGWKHRKEVTETVLDNFALQNIKLTNTYQTQGNLQGYLNEMKRSKFILAPSGLGWDCYRIWEALYMGCIPIVERYGRSNDGWWRTLDKLPILIVEHFSKKMTALPRQYNLIKKGENIQFLERTPTRYLEVRIYSLAHGELPCILHFVHVTPGLPEDQASLPSDIKETIEKWQTMHLRSAIALWNNKAIRQSFPELIPILEQIHTMSWVSNLVRYHVLERCGGIYLDTDIVPLQSLWQLRQARFGPAFSVCENPNNLQIRHSLDGYIIDRRLRTCQQRCDWRYGPSSCFSSGHQRGYDQHGTRTEHESWRTVQTENIGPPVWTKAVRDHNVKVLHASLFFPCSWDNKHD